MHLVKFLELAQNELDDLFEAYEYKQKDLGYDFIKEIENTIFLIQHNPQIWSKVSDEMQRCVVKGFPYAILYHKVEETIIVVAIMSLLKKPIHLVLKSNACRISHLPETIYLR